MNPASRSGTATSVPAVPDPSVIVDALVLLGLAAELEYEAFARIAADSTLAPDVAQRQVIAGTSRAALARQDRLIARIVELGADPAEAMAPFDGALDDFEERTTPAGWWERLLKAYVAYAIADDFISALAAGTDPTTSALVVEVLADHSHAELAVRELTVVILGDDALRSRLALWGRRLVGDALGFVQGLVLCNPSLARLLDNAESDVPLDADRVGRLFGTLTAEHTRRMDRLGLTA